MANQYEDRDRGRERESDRDRNQGEGRYETMDRRRQGDWGPQGRWGSFGNRPDYSPESDWDQGRSRDWGSSERSDFGGVRSSRTNLFGTGGGGFGTGFSSYGAGTGPYAGGMGSYGDRGRHVGRGPKGWQRSDDRIREDINERLTDHPHVDASEIEVTVQAGEVTLTGTVEDRQAKRLAEDIAESVSGVRDVHNQIRLQTSTTNVK